MFVVEYLMLMKNLYELQVMLDVIMMDHNYLKEEEVLLNIFKNSFQNMIKHFDRKFIFISRREDNRKFGE